MYILMKNVYAKINMIMFIKLLRKNTSEAFFLYKGNSDGDCIVS